MSPMTVIGSDGYGIASSKRPYKEDLSVFDSVSSINHADPRSAQPLNSNVNQYPIHRKTMPVSMPFNMQMPTPKEVMKPVFSSSLWKNSLFKYP